jgi:hypothetical protein
MGLGWAPGSRRGRGSGRGLVLGVLVEMQGGHYGEVRLGAVDDQMVLVRVCVRWNERGRGIWDKKAKPSGGGSVSGVPSQTAMEGIGGGCRGAGDDEVVAVGKPIQWNVRGRGF